MDFKYSQIILPEIVDQVINNGKDWQFLGAWLFVFMIIVEINSFS